jgi:DNA invertase Pin-like site-specific DNA recombinase
MTKAVGYIRVSTEKQATGGMSLAAQRAQLEAYASLYEIELVGIEEDAGASAKSLHRDGLARALERLESGETNALLISKLDRLTRSVVDLNTLIKDYFMGGTGLSLLSVNEHIDTRSAGGRMILSVITVIGEWERASASERTSASLQAKKRRGEYTGGPVPYGFRLGDDGVHLEANAPERHIILEAKKRRLRGWSLRRVGRSLTADGLYTRNGKPWHPAQVARLLEAH